MRSSAMSSPLRRDGTQSPRARFGPSLSTMPLEIKRLIVEEASEYSVSRKEWQGRRRDSQYVPTMRSLALVNREFAALAQPFLWRFLDLSDDRLRHLDSLDNFVTTVLPRHGHHIKLLALSQFEASADGLGRGWTAPVRRSAKPCVPRKSHPAARRLADPDTAFIRRRSFLLAQAIASMPQLAKVNFNFRYLPDIQAHVESEDDNDVKIGRLKRGEMQERREAADAVPLALVAIGDRLTDLTLFERAKGARQDIGFGTFDEADLASFLSSFPSLTRLSLRFSLQPDPEEPASLLSTLASLRHLRYLHLHAIDFFGDMSAAPSWTSPLETLSLTLGPTLPVPTLSILLAQFSATLTVLRLQKHPGCIDHTNPSTVSTTPFPIPHLHTLFLDTQQSDVFLDSFDLCPLEDVTINDCPKISLGGFEAFVATHVTTLRRFDVSALKARPSLQFLGLQTLCETNGIRFNGDSDEEEGSMDDE